MDRAGGELDARDFGLQALARAGEAAADFAWDKIARDTVKFYAFAMAASAGRARGLEGWYRG